jgi:hypothetical protein
MSLSPSRTRRMGHMMLRPIIRNTFSTPSIVDSPASDHSVHPPYGSALIIKRTDRARKYPRR